MDACRISFIVESVVDTINVQCIQKLNNVFYGLFKYLFVFLNNVNQNKSKFMG